MSTTLTITDLAPSEALDREAMTAICGGFAPRNLINQELNALTIVGAGSLFIGGDTDLRVTNTYSQSANQIDGGSSLDALKLSLGQLGKLSLN